ncbi:hypothetical protein [Mycolicibacterium tusciae]|uniref:hypothetical protein n=1 Tax=Mycolicibacterium tusciae TaxID=75922 RepID=UPI001EF9B687|nr:hypothetical protein [Mycolicibacterium tusciae]
MNAAAGAVVGVLALTLVIVVAVGWMLWSTPLAEEAVLPRLDIAEAIWTCTACATVGR